MSKIDIERNHNFGVEEVKAKVAGLESDLHSKYGVQLDWNGYQADVKGTGLSGTLRVEETRLSVSLELGLMLRPVAGKIRQGLERGLDKALG